MISHLILTQLPEVPEVQPSNQGLIQAWLLQGPFLEPIELARAGLDPLLRLHPSISSCYTFPPAPLFLPALPLPLSSTSSPPETSLSNLLPTVPPT